MTNQFEDDFYMEDMIRTTKHKKKRKKNKINYFLKLITALLILVLIMYIGLLLFEKVMESNKTEPASAPIEVQEEQEITYTQEELDKLLAENSATAGNEAAAKKEQEILSFLKKCFSGGESTVEALRPLYQNDIVVASGGRIHFVPIREDLKQNHYVEENLQILENGEYQYLENGQVISHKGIDVSKHQGNIDWKQVAEDGVEFAFIRVALRGYGTGNLVEDEYFEDNVKGAINAGIKVGVYIYSQAINEEEVLEEANFVLEKISPYRIQCPVVFDVEKVSGADGRMNELSAEERTKLTALFCETIENAGYQPMIYHNMEMGALLIDLAQLEKYDKWFAYYNKDMYYPYEYKIWQYSEKGTVKGIKGAVDLNISFAPLWDE